MVIIYHSTIYTSERLTSNFPRYEQGGIYSIILFFTISGFVMVVSSENLRFQPSGWRTFALKRIVRIVPIYWIMTTFKLIMLLIGTSFSLNSGIDPLFIVKSYLFIPAINSKGLYFPLYSVGWTLNYEMFYYFLFTISLVLRLNPIVFLSIIFIPLSILSFRNFEWPGLSFYFDPIILNFLLGMIAAKLVLKKIYFFKASGLPVIVISLLYLFVPKAGLLTDFFPNNLMALYLASFFIVYAAASIEGTYKTFIPKWIILLGSASYSLYLVHPLVAPLAPVLLNWFNLQLPWLSVFFGVLMSLGVGTLFYKLCENPLTHFISKFVYAREDV